MLPLAKKCLVALFAGMLLCGCVTMNTTKPDTPDVDARPAWIDNPGEGVSASAGVHVRGRVAQEELAISRAREEMAKRKGVKIDSENNIQQRYAAGRMTTQTDKQIMETVSGVEVKSQVKAKWIDPGSGVIWIWLVPER